MSGEPPPRKRSRRKAALNASAKLVQADYTSEALARLKQLQRVIVFSGAGLSVSAGLSTFTDLYAQAAKKYGGNGMHAFHYRFLHTSPKDCFEFLLQQWRCVQKAAPTKAHQAIQAMEESEQLIRHYTLNIDHLLGSDKTVELHGSLEQLVCRECGEVCNSVDALGKKTLPSNLNVPPKCSNCKTGELRFRVLLYEDQEGQLIHPSWSAGNPLETTLAEDMKQCEWIVWVGVSFQQSASCEHFRKMLEAKPAPVPVYIVSPEASQALDLLQSAVGCTEGIYPVPMTSDEFFASSQQPASRSSS